MISEWLELMLAEIARKKEAEAAAVEEAARRAGTPTSCDTPKVS